jgi:hypothetical protein
MAEENYYQLLGLSPDVDDWPTVEKAIHAWRLRASQVAGGAGRSPDLHKAPQIEKALREEATRQVHRQRERERLASQKKAASAQFLQAVKYLKARPGQQYTEEDIRAVIVRLGGAWDEMEVRRQLQAVGIVVASRQPPPTSAPSPTVEDVLLMEMQQNVEMVAKARGWGETIYWLLEYHPPDRTPPVATVGPSTNFAELLRLAKVEYDRLSKIGLTDDVSTAHRKALSTFKNQLDLHGKKAKSRYDDYLSQKVLDALKGNLELMVGATGVVTPPIEEHFVALAREHGQTAEAARAYLTRYAADRHWVLSEPSTRLRAESLAVCGYCHELSDATKAYCRCGKPLREPCPNPQCGEKDLPTSTEVCPSCGYHVGNAALYGVYLKSADILLRDGNYEEAEALVRCVLKGWPNYAPGEELRRTIERDREELRQSEEEVKRLLQNRQGEAAKNRLNRGPGRLRAHYEMLREAERLVDEAGRLVDEGARLQAQGKADAAIDKFEEALRKCADSHRATQALASCPPAAPTGLRLGIRDGVAQLIWSASPSRGQVRYRVLRKAGSPPRGPEDGERVATVAETVLLDPGAPGGVSLYYAVHAERGSVPSPAGAGAGPLLLAREVEDARALGRDGCVELAWRLPPGATGAEVWCQPGRAPTRGQGRRLAVVEPMGAVDGGLTNGQVVGYLVVVVFRDAGDQDVHSAGQPLTATPVAPPSPLTGLQVSREGDGLVATWPAPRRGQVLVFVSPDEPRVPPGALLSTAELGRLGRRLNPDGPLRATGPAEAGRRSYVVPVTVVGETAVVGRAASLTEVAEVQDLCVRRRDDRLVCTWRWPEQCTTTVLVCRPDQFPAGANDPRATRYTCERVQYDRSGGFALPVPRGSRLYIVACTAQRTADGWEHSAGTGPGSRRELVLESFRRLRYRFGPSSALDRLRGRGEYQLRIVPDGPAVLPALRLVVRSREVPLETADGVEVLTVPAGTRCTPNRPYKIWVPAGRVPQDPKAKLFPLNPHEAGGFDFDREV